MVCPMVCGRVFARCRYQTTLWISGRLRRPGTSSGEAMKIRPLHDRVIVKRLDNERKTASGIVIPDNVAEKPDQGEVLAIGPGKRDDNGKLIPIDLKVGDRILFGKYA